MALKILLADDSMTAQNMGKKILLDAGYDVVAVSNGAAAIKRIASDHPDIIILDVYMPGYTGLEVCERIKAARETARTPVLLTVGKMEPFKPEDANRVKADGVMVKPFEASDLIAVVQSFGKPAGSAASPKQQDVRPTPVQTVPISRSPDPVQEDTVRLTPEQLRAFQEASFKQWGPPPTAPANPAPEMAVVAPMVDDLDAVITPSPISYGQREEPEPEEVEPFAASSVLDALDRNLPPESPVVSIPDVTISAAPVSDPAAPLEIASILEPMGEITPDVESGPVTPYFTVSPYESESGPAIDFTPATPAFVESVSPELETSAQIAEVPTLISQLQDLEANVAPPVPVDVAPEIAPEIEINSPPELLEQQVEVATDPALVTDPDDLAGFTTKFGDPQAEEIKVGLVSDLPEEQLAAITHSGSLPQEVANEISSVLGVPLVPQAFNGSNAAAHVIDEAFAPAADEAPQPSAVFEQPIESEKPVGRMVELATLSLEPQPMAEAPTLQSAEPETVTLEIEHVAPEEEATLAAAAGLGAPEGTVSFNSVLVEPRSSLSTEETTTFVAETEPVPAEPEPAPVELAEKLAEALVTNVVVETPVESKDPGATELHLSEAVARAFERLKPQLITEILKELRK